MNTLNKRYTTKFFNNPEDYEELIKRWKELVNSDERKNLTASDFLCYAIIRGKDYKKAFFPGRKMQEYNLPEGLYRALLFGFGNKFQSEFGDLLSGDWKSKVRSILPPTYLDNFYELDSYIDDKVENLLTAWSQTTVAKVAVVEKKSLVSKVMNFFGGNG